MSPPELGPFAFIYYVNFTDSNGVTLDLTHDNAMLAFQHIMYAYSSSSCFNIDIEFDVHNESFY